MMRAYVSIRGSRSPRSVTRDAEGRPGALTPFAALVIQGDDYKTTRYELEYAPDSTGRIYVYLYEHREGDRRRVVAAREV